MNRRFVLIAAVAATLIGALAYFYGGSQVPSGQPALESLTAGNVADVARAFNEASDRVRVVLLFSPT